MVLNSLKIKEKHTNPKSKLAAKLYQLQGNIIKLSTASVINNPVRIISNALHFARIIFHQYGQKMQYGGDTNVENLIQTDFSGLSCFPRGISVFITVRYTSHI